MKLVKLSHAEHGNLKIVNNCTINIAENQHVIALRVNEVGQAATSFPVFLNRVADTDDWSLSAMTSLEAGSNLFVKDNLWHAPHIPSNMQTYPLFLMQAEEEEKGYAVGILPGEKDFSEEEGAPIFNEDGEMTDLVKNMVTLLEDDIKNSAQTRQFTKTLAELELIKPTNLLVRYTDGKLNKITGLTTIDEDKLRNLEADKFLELRENGYLIAIYSIMLSPYQLQALINRHNLEPKNHTITQVQLDFNTESES